MADFNAAIGTFNAVLLLEPEAVQALADAMHLHEPKPKVTTVEGTWVTGVFAANNEVVIMDRRHYDAFVAMLKNPTQVQVSGATSDGYHTFDELYEHRHALFLALMRVLWQTYFVGDHIPWIEDDPTTPGWFLAGIDTPYGQIAYHLPNALRPVAERHAVPHYKRTPYDGYLSADVLKRVQALAGYPAEGVQP